MHDVARKRALARRAAEEDWSRNRLRQEIEEQGGKRSPKRRRGAKDPLAVAVAAVKRAVEAAERGAIAPEGLDDLSRPELERVAKLLQSAVGILGRSLTVSLRLLAHGSEAQKLAARS